MSSSAVLKEEETGLLYGEYQAETYKSEDTENITGSEIFAHALINEGVDTIFGYPGGVILGLYDTIIKYPQLKHVLVRHEQGATHMADGYARATGKPGVVLVTSGPGGTNTVTGIATAYMDSIPLVVFTGQVPSGMIGNDAFQESDIVGITRPITKYSYLIKDVSQFAQAIHEAFYIARTGRPGPVLIDMPKDMLLDSATYKKPEKISIRGYNPTIKGHVHQISRAAEMITSAKRPVIYAGGGINSGNAHEELFALATAANVPVTTTLMGGGAFPSGHDLSLGMLGMHGTWYANMAVCECDLLIAVGTRFDDRVTGKLDGFSPKSKKIHVDIDPACISKNVEVDIPIVGHVKNVLREMNKKVGKADTGDWLELIEKWKREHPLKYSCSDDFIKPQYVLQKISEITGGDAIVATDVGQHQMWTAQYYNFNKARSLISSGGLGTMGFGFPAAVGAAIGRPDRTVVCISGDGGFQMTSFELATAVKNRVPVKAAIMNNGYLGMVRQWQDLFFDKVYAHTRLKENNPDYVKLAESYGAVGLRARRPEEVEPVLKEAFGISDRPVIMEFVCAEEENVFPMVPAGASLYEMIEQ